MKVSFEGIGEQVLSFMNDEAKAGDLVKVSENNTVAPCEEDDSFAGICIKADSDFADVKTAGYVECAYSGTAPDVGFAILTADGEGNVQAAEAGREYLVINVDTTNKVIGFMM